MRLAYFIVRRLFLLPAVAIGVMIIVFLIAYVVPADPVYLFIGQESDPQLVARVRSELGLDQPIWTQFYIYVRNFLRGNFGMCWSTRNSVRVDLATRLPATFELVFISLLLCIMFAFPLGLYAAVKRDSIGDHFVRIISTVGVAVPGFWLALVLIYVFFYQLGWAPAPTGRIGVRTLVKPITGFYLLDTLLKRDWKTFGEVWAHLALPVAAISFRSIAHLTRLIRTSMLEVLESDFVQAEMAQGLSKRLIYYRLALKNALLAPITQIGEQFGTLIGGTVVIELIFAWPGAGRWAISSALAGDFAPIQAFTVICAIIRVLVFLITDIAYAVIDPRIRY